jgi:hypothetical protein
MEDLPKKIAAFQSQIEQGYKIIICTRWFFLVYLEA